MDQAVRQPTRVNNACDRCRKQKQRCDPGRPCRLCLRAKVDCTTDVPPAKRRRTDVELNVRARSISATSPSISAVPFISQHAHSTSLPNVSAVRPSHLACDNSYPNHTGETSTPETRPENSPFGSTSQTSHGSAALANLVGTDSALGLTRKIFSSGKENTFQTRETFAIPGGDSPLARTPRRAQQRSITIERLVGLKLPPRSVCDQLLEVYFSTVHWFSLVVYEPTFRSRYSTIIDSGTASDTDYSFVLLLLMVLVMGCWYTPENTVTLSDSDCGSLEELRAQFFKVVREHFIDVIDEDGIESVQLCALLGSFHLYHGRPRSSFSILGAATKTSQAIGLHRISDPRLTMEEAEERKRIWWTIYTWDRFASITYGRPLGICDKDCNILMPLDSLENVTFRTDATPKMICLSTYQTKLNLIYQIASPLLENMYAIRTSHATQLQPDLINMVAKAYDSMETWYSELPSHLRLDSTGNVSTSTSEQENMHKLQALSLQLTYDNLVIVLHRPLLADRMQKSWQSSHFNQSSNHSQLYQTPQSTSFRRCLDAALRISRLQQSQDLLLLARSTHLVSFMGMNLFTASIVLFICAMSDVLSDIAQEAKRGLKRILQIQKQLSSHASLSKQCSAILEDLIQLVLAQEMEDMLCPHPSPRMEFSVEDGSGSLESRWDIGGHPRSQVFDSSINTRTNSHTDYIPNDETFLRNSLVSLRKVFAGNNNDMQVINTDGTLRNHTYHNNDLVVDETTSNEYINVHNYGSNTRMEDLGQFWLWDFDIPE